ncbi:MarR family winged helix-turn-helix transcriptional regulator [Starkeya koreensis]|uniref:MarR family winged helix-turn-helix transcriptional regulator n=1 Tax=Ancylobacter koreensis TaxID=266121 RepID=A0ABT0DHA4_9HYPH|nr:MarR family winged helix-turn-helix transcriptional regulator [Ancylobacter koreensis]MCK0206654.1 MarR family winged helix-turn-helix transcriptional regulator [Ancylobacter koreensis]
MSTDEASPLSLSHVAANCLCRRVQHASRSVGKRFDDAFRGTGLNNWQFTMLMALSSSSAPRTIGQVAAELGMDRTTTTKNLGPLERRGLVAVRADEKDARVRRVVLTPEGAKVLGDAMARWQAVNDEVAAGLTPEQLATLRAALDIIARL